MRTHIHNTVQLGELVAAVFDSAAEHGGNPEEVSRLATSAVTYMLRHARRTLIAPSTPTACIQVAN